MDSSGRLVLPKRIRQSLNVPRAATFAEYFKLLDHAGPAGARGGTICDLLLLACARQAKAERIYTLNVRHFAALAPDLAPQIVTPGK